MLNRILQKNNFVEKVWPANVAFLFMFWPIMLKQLNSLTSLDVFNWLCGQEVTLQTAVWEVPGSITGSGKDFYVCFFVLLLLCFYFFVQNTLFIMKFYNSFCNVN